MKRKTIEARKAVRSVIGLLAVAWIGLAAAGCGIEDTNGSKIEDVEFTVLEEEAVPEELKQEIEERKEMDFKLTYEDNGKLYIARGYGEKETDENRSRYGHWESDTVLCMRKTGCFVL